jgi:hypothetical protein
MTYRIDAKTPKGQAGQLLRAVNLEARASSAPETAFIRKTSVLDDSFSPPKRSSSYAVIWEEGPFEWGVIGSGGGNIWCEELGYKLYDPRLEPTFDIAPHVNFGHGYSFDFTFYPR